MFDYYGLYSCTLIPRSLNCYTASMRSYPDHFHPRNARAEGKWCRHPAITTYVRLVEVRTLRLMLSLEELRKYVDQYEPGTRSSRPYEFPDEKSSIYPNDDFVRQSFERAFKACARKISLAENCEEKRKRAEEERLKEENSGFPYWRGYLHTHAQRRKWGEYFRSCLDWDWNLGKTLHLLFKMNLPLTSPSSSPALPAPTQTLEAEAGDTLFIESGHLPKTVRVAYETEAGETRYMTFVPDTIPDLEASAKVPEKDCGHEMLGDATEDCEAVVEEKKSTKTLSRTEEWVRDAQKDY